MSPLSSASLSSPMATAKAFPCCFFLQLREEFTKLMTHVSFPFKVDLYLKYALSFLVGRHCLTSPCVADRQRPPNVSPDFLLIWPVFKTLLPKRMLMICCSMISFLPHGISLSIGSTSSFRSPDALGSGIFSSSAQIGSCGILSRFATSSTKCACSILFPICLMKGRTSFPTAMRNSRDSRCFSSSMSR